MKNFFSLILLLFIGSNIQAQFQVVHDVPNTNVFPPRISTVITTDSGMITLQKIDTLHLFRKYDSQGELIWNKLLDDTAQTPWSHLPTMIRNNSGGCLFARYAGAGAYTSFPPEPSDSSWTYFNVMELDGNGNVIMSMQIRKFHRYMMYVNVNSLELALSQDGSIFLLVTYDQSPGGFIELYKIQSDGELAWGRSVGRELSNTYEGDPNPTYAFAQHPEARMTVDALGNVYLTERGQYGAPDLLLTKLAPNGELLWTNRYNYSNTSVTINFEGMQVDGSGKVHGGGSLMNPAGQFVFFMSLDGNGSVDRADIYRMPEMPSSYNAGRFGMDNEGRRYYMVSHVLPNSNGQRTQIIAQADTSGSPALFLRRNDQVILPNNVFVPLQDMDVYGDRVGITAVLNHEDVDFAFTTRYETAFSFHTDDLFSCVLTDSTLAHLPVPLVLFTTTQPDNAASIDISEHVDVYPMTAYTISDAATEPLEILCTFAYNLLGGQVGVEEIFSAEMALVQQTLIPRGSPLVLVHPDVARVELFNSTGQLLMQASIVPGHMSISGTDRAYGVHLLRAYDRSGSLIGVQRVMIE